ncbi:MULTISPECIES: hypothetical protein [Microcoleaceae]|uniref:hypothetical protein n=1 Tax=Lyngbya sp. CCAP 1446/10 TaxID=439293 RepID=UPI002AA2B415|nr:hypothetical protein [Lyngbya sp. CCAP 1446/10]
MELSPLYLQRLEDATQRGIEQGMQQGIEQGIEQAKRLIVESVLQVRFGEIDEELAQIIEPLIQLETLDDCTRLTMQLDRSQLLARFQPKNQTES